MSQLDRVETQSDWASQADAVAESMALTTAVTKDLNAFAETQVVPTTPPQSTPKSPLESTGDEKTKANDAALSALASTKSKEEGPASASKQPVAGAVKLTDESMLQARKAFAEHHGLLLENVTPDMIHGDASGAVFWATKGLNLSARGPAAQAMGRAIKHRPEIKELYMTLLDNEKVKFRAAWAATRDWDFVSVERSTVSSYRKRKEEVGVFRTQLQLENILGGADHELAKQQAANYISMCLRPDLKEFCWSYNDWLKADTYLWVESLVSTSCQTEWINKVTIQSQDNVASSWTEKLEYCKAVRVFAAENDVAIKDITQDMLEGHELGIKGLAALYSSTPKAQPQPGGDGTCSKPVLAAPAAAAPSAAKAKAKAKGKAKGPSEGDAQGDDPMQGSVSTLPPADDEKNNNKKPKKTGGSKANTTTKKEKELKEFLAMETQSDHTMSSLTADMGKDPAAWSWARDFVEAYKGFRKDILQLYADNEFFRQAKVAALSSKETTRLRKAYPDGDYVAKLCEFACQLGPKIQGMYDCTVKIRQMADAHANAVAPPKPSSKGSARKPKRSASQASLSC
ncbi:unnamed protein product [Symbiodinium microadriaticum]|nr:unnamed protein product [Symbiodinium microadriaticum]